MAATVTPPLASPRHYDPAFKVDTHLHEPLLSRASTPSDVRLDMMALCYQLESLCKKELVEQSCVRNGHVSNMFIDRATMVQDRMLHLMAKVPPEYKDYVMYIRSQGLDSLFPRAMAYLQNPYHFSLDPDKTSLDNYFSSLSQLSQLSTLARQIHNDCVNPDSHKYIAHQLALLYQALSAIKATTFVQHKSSIEEMFKPIKATLSAEQEHARRCLTQEQQEWLSNLTSNIISILAEFPAELTQDLLQPALILTKQS